MALEGSYKAISLSYKAPIPVTAAPPTNSISKSLLLGGAKISPASVIDLTYIKLTSGFRTPELNKNLSGSSKTSVHMQGYAMDIVPVNGRMDEFIKFVKNWAKDKNYDQILFESNKKGSRWVHFGLYNNAGQQRQQMKYLHV